MKRLATGAALGSLAAYFFDPKLGADRRERLYSLWEDKKDTAVQAGQTATRAFESARPVAMRMTKAVGAADWGKVLEKPRRSASLPKLIGAAAVGGAVMYFFDPTRGSARRSAAVMKGRSAAAKMAAAGQTARRRVVNAMPTAERRARAKTQVG